jgi:hypothetical protein
MPFGRLLCCVLGAVAASLAASSCREAASPPPGDAPVGCSRDTDCHAPGCGPCSSGAPITEADIEKECVTNPCTVFVGAADDRRQLPAPAAVCSANRTCMIR